ncbi:MAG TPA: DUF4956 domain-containing protein [Myxococcaceae bacterium]|nr:DUF4956 domain-containing protein [Myxococcaceae bacterium]
MDELIKELERFKDLTSAFTLTDVAIVMALSFVLTVGFAAVYRYTHRGTSYSQSFAQTLVVMGMVTAVIMLIIGSNIARAFSLVGALSVIRFRNAVKETRDVAFMFVAMAIGMACGTRFYLLAGFATSVISAVIILMHRVNAFDRQVGERLLRVRMPPERDPDHALDPVFRSLLTDSRLVSMETVAGGTLQELVYSIALKSPESPRRLLEAIREVNGNNKVVLVVGQQEVDL